VRVFVDGKRRALGTYASADEAEAVLGGALAVLGESEHREGVTLARWGEAALDRREAQGLRGIERERSRWATHVAASELAELPVKSIVRSDVQRWVDRLVVTRAQGARGGKTLARNTALNALSLLRIVLEDAVARGVAPANPAAGVRLPRSRGRTHETWTYLDVGEQRRLLELVPAHARPAVGFAIHAGLRQGEQWALELADVHLDAHVPHVWVRYGGPNRAPTKNGRPRRVDLLPGAVEALRAQLELVDHLSATEARKGKPWNPLGLVFPSLRGSMRARGAPAGWEVWCERAKLGRSVPWHALRHTCASSLVAGWWGRAWTLTEVCALLGHSSIKVTERYAHLAGTITQEAVMQTTERPRSAHDAMERAKRALRRASKEPESPAFSGSHLRGLNSRPTVYESVGLPNGSASLGPNSGHAWALVARERAIALADAVASGDVHVVMRALDLAETVLDATSAAPRLRGRLYIASA
jgi:integrase